MSRRAPFVRFVTLLLATLQVASPSLSAIADGRLALENASQPATHIEATTTAACPVVHHPDCGICRYLSSAASTTQGPSFDLHGVATLAAPITDVARIGCATVALPDGRAPPTL